jgi:4-hydroxy-tetrahydrodipicolinate synthase
MMFTGSITALITPFRDGVLDEEALIRLVEFQCENGTTGLVPCGTTGESPTLTPEEHERVVALTVQAARAWAERTGRPRVPVIAGAGSNNTSEAIHYSQAAARDGADGLLQITPYYNKPTQEGLYRHFAAIAAATELPIILYNVPGRTGVNMTAETTLRMAREIPNIIGVKEASANMEQILTILRDRPKDFLVLSGDDAWTLPLLGCGADGLVSVASNEVPKLIAEMVATKSREIHERLLPLLLGNFIESNPGPVKAAMKMMGILQSDTLRPPLAPITEASRKKLETILRECRLP